MREHEWVRTDKINGVLQVLDHWICVHCMTKVSGSPRSSPKALAFFKKILPDCQEQLVKNILQS